MALLNELLLPQILQDPAQLALAWCYSRWFVASTIIGATNLTQLQENIDAAQVTLSPELVAGVEAIHAEMVNPGQ